MADRDLVVRFIGDDRDLQRAFKKSEKGAQSLNARLTNASAGIARWGKAAAIAGAAAAAGLVVIGTRGVKAASDLNEEINKSSVLFGDSADAILKWSKTTSASIGLSQRAALQGAGNFGAMFATIGVGEKTSAAMSKQLVQLSADLGSFSNQSPEEMLDRLRSGLAGEAEPLRRFGILLSEARVKQEAVRMGLAKAGDELTEQQKVQARYSLILQDSAKAQGDFARTSDSFANAQRIARAQIEDLSATLGRALLPAVAKALVAFNRFLPVLTSGIGRALERISPSIQKMADAFSGRIPEIRRLLLSVAEPIQRNILPILRDLWGIWQRTWAGILDVLSQNRDSIRRILQNIGATLRAVWTVARPTIVFLFEKVLPRALKISIAVMERVTRITRTLAAVFTRSVSFILRAIEKFIGGLSFLARAASHLPFVGDKFKGIGDKIDVTRESLRKFSSDLDALDGKQVNVGINVRVRTADEHGRGAAGAAKTAGDAVTEQATRGLQETTQAAESLTTATNAATGAAKTARTAAEKARDAFDKLMESLGVRLDKAAVTRRLNDDLAVLRAMERAVLEQVKIEGRTAELERQLFDIRQQRLELRRQRSQSRQFLALGLTAEGEKRGPSVANLRKRLGTLRQQIKGTPLDTQKTRTQLAQIAKVLRGAYGKVGKEVRDAILQMLNDISGALKSGTESIRSGTGEITRGGIRSTEKLIKGLGLTKAQADAIRRRNRGITRRGGLSAFGFAIDGEKKDEREIPRAVRIDPRRLGGRGGDAALLRRLRGAERRDTRIDTRRRGGRGGDIIINGPITVVSDDPDDFMRKLQKKASRTSGSRRGRHGGVRLGLG